MLRLFLWIFMLCCQIITPFQGSAQVSGCTDPQSINYNPSATINDGSCTYASTNLPLTDKTSLSAPLLNESSGLTFINGKLWTFCDSGNPNDIYRIDTATATVMQTVDISNASNVDWEDMTSSNDYLFIGDFGNNNGNRQDLKIYRINKADLTGSATTVTASVINFSYSDQTSFPSLPNNNNFDCEAMIFLNDSIHLFSKNWVDNQTRHYVLANSPGTRVAQYRETYNTGFLVTSAAVQSYGVIALIGYLKTGSKPVSLCMLYDYKNHLFFNGNKRKFDLSTMTVNGQVEGIEFYSPGVGFITNELYTSGASVPAKLRTINIAPYLPAAYLYPRPTADFTGNNVTVCENAFVQFSDQSTASPVSWKWSFPGGTPATSTLQNPLVQYSIAGSYPVTLIASNNAGSDTLVKINFITVNPFPAATISANGPTVFCQGGTVELNANTGTGMSYQWKINGVDISGANTASFLAGNAGIYTCQVTNNCGNAISNAITVSINPAPPSPAQLTGATLVCKNTTGNAYTITPVNGATSYAWTVPSGATLASGQGTISISVDFLSNAQNGSICVSATNNCGSSTVLCLPVSVTTSFPAKPASINGSPIVCAGSTGIVYSCPVITNATAYNWIVPATASIVSGQGTNAITVDFQTGFTSGNIKVSALNCKGSSAFRSLTVQGKPFIPAAITGPSEEVCAGSTNVAYSVSTANGATVYSWTAPANATVASGQGTTSILINYNSAFKSGTLKVAAGNTCGTSSNRTLIIHSKPVVPNVITGPATACAHQSNVAYTINPVAGASAYSWTVPPGALITAGQNSTSILVNYGTMAGNVKVKAMNACGSSANCSLQVSLNCRMQELTGPTDFDPVILPNPGNSHFRLLCNTNNGSEVTFILRDYTGREVVRYDHLDPAASFDFGTGLSPGIYLAELRSGATHKIIRLINQ